MTIKQYMKQHKEQACVQISYASRSWTTLLIGFSEIHDDIFYYVTESGEQDGPHGPYFFGFSRESIESIINEPMEDKYILQEPIRVEWRQ